MELLAGQSLQTFMKSKFKNREKFTDRDASKIMKGILQGVAYIHEKSISHRALKPKNILITDDNTIKLIDFGLGNQQVRTMKSDDEYCGTLIFMAPEVAAKQKYTKQVDIWSTGIIMHLLLTGGKHPIYRETDSYDGFKKKLVEIKSVEPDNSLTDLAKSLFKRLCQI